ncbi:MAG: hypothetical protein JXB07_19430 [Anaerolineae bacterium]|nr:hypothetical protein [Anaerolineae bacterium]
MGPLTGKYTPDAKWAANDVRTRDWFQQGFAKPIFDNLPRIREVLPAAVARWRRAPWRGYALWPADAGADARD